MYQTRACNPSGCSSESRCTLSASCNPSTTTTSSTTTTISYVANYCPDVDRNGVIDQKDVDLVNSYYGQTNCPPYDCDLDNSGGVRSPDVSAVTAAVSSDVSKYPC